MFEVMDLSIDLNAHCAFELNYAKLSVSSSFFAELLPDLVMKILCLQGYSNGYQIAQKRPLWVVKNPPESVRRHNMYIAQK